MSDLLSAATACLAALAALTLLVPLACLLGLVDFPSGRKRHGGGVPVVGGLGVLVGGLAAVQLAGPLPAGLHWLLAALVPVLIVGVLDDRRALPPLPRLLAQLAAVLTMSLGGGVLIGQLGTFGGEVLVLGVLGLPFTLFAVVGVINAANMSDGMDGLAAGQVLVTLAGLIVVAGAADLEQHTRVLWIVAGALTAFLLLNLSRGRFKVFLGDAGSMSLGVLVAWFLIDLTQRPEAPLSPAAALWLFGPPVIDAVGVIVVRLMAGRSPLKPDRLHLHYLLLDIGLPPSRVYGLLVGGAGVMALFGLAGQWLGVADHLLLEGFVALFGFTVLLRLYLARRESREGPLPWEGNNPRID